ncbi:MAG: hypothetical protein IAE82_04765 [Opitutaceae bacterium]|nr:hypothetical protein [Opitutaceae bacterium]
MNAPAVFLGIQPGFLHLPPIELFNLLAPVGEYPIGSTVSRQTLESHGYRVDFVQPEPVRRRLKRAVALVSRVESPARAA